MIEVADGHSKLLVSLGSRDKLSSERVRRAGRVAARWLTEAGKPAAGVQVSFLEQIGVAGAVNAFCEGLLLGAFRFDRHKSVEAIGEPTTVHILADDNLKHVEQVVARSSGIVAGANLARELAHEPPNIINPLTLAEGAQQLASEKGLKCSVLGEKELTEMGANAILSVGLGSKTPSQMIILEYPGAGEKIGTAPVVIAGKAITFDTGGYSLKDTTGIVGMKYDKCGGAAVLGIMGAVADLELETPVVGMVAAAENMISPDAYRPNDIIKTLSGKTVEIIATLTGGIVVALGSVRAGLFSNDDTLAEALMTAGERTGEKVWRMPLDDEYFELIRGDDSDFKNSSGKRKAHPIVGGIFLKQFVSDAVPWAHLDIAGVDNVTTELPYAPIGATGFGVRLLVDYLSGLD
jgi:leucyl aminopeptidase